MHRKGILSLTIVIGLVVASFVVPIVFARGNPQLSLPKVRWAAGSLDATGAVVGLANEDYIVELYAQGSASGECVNPAGDRRVQGRNPSPIVVAVRESEEAETDQNGNFPFNLTASEETQYILISPTPKEFGCPNKNWSVEIEPGTTEWTDAQLSLYPYPRDGEPPLDEAYFECDITTPDICTLVE